MQGPGDDGAGGRGGGAPSGSQFDPAQCKSLYVGNLHLFVTEQMLQDIFSVVGAITEVKIIKDKVTGMSAGYGFIKFYDHQSAEHALSTINGRMLYGQEVRVNWAFQKDQREDTTSHFHIFVGDLSPEVNDRTLYEGFAGRMDGCSDARVMWDHNTGRSKGYGFVSFRTRDIANNAIATMNGEFIGTRRVRCGWAQHKQEMFDNDVSVIDKADPNNTNIYVGNLGPEVTDQYLRDMFAKYGIITETKVYRKGSYGFVTFQRHEDAVQAIASTNGQDIGNGRVMKVSWGRHQQRSGMGGHGGQGGGVAALYPGQGGYMQGQMGPPAYTSQQFQQPYQQPGFLTQSNMGLAQQQMPQQPLPHLQPGAQLPGAGHMNMLPQGQHSLAIRAQLGPGQQMPQHLPPAPQQQHLQQGQMPGQFPHVALQQQQVPQQQPQQQQDPNAMYHPMYSYNHPYGGPPGGHGHNPHGQQ